MKKYKIHSANCGSFIVKGNTVAHALQISYTPSGYGRILSIKEVN
jgi:hypothetical protein